MSASQVYMVGAAPLAARRGILAISEGEIGGVTESDPLIGR